MARTRLPVAWDVNELETLQYRRLYRWDPSISNALRAGIWNVLERWASRRSTVIVAISAAEARACEHLLPAARGRVRVVLHRVPFPASRRSEDFTAASLSTFSSGAAPRLVFVGNLAAKHNRRAAQWILDELAPRASGRFEILFVGPGSDTLCIGERLEGSVARLGVVDDLSQVISPTDIGIAPLAAGAGVKTKMLDYLSLGCRIVATPAALEGLEGCPGVAVSPLDGFVATVSALASASESTAALCQRVQSQHRWLATYTSPDDARSAWRAIVGELGLSQSSS